jgi:hypothetical protein
MSINVLSFIIFGDQTGRIVAECLEMRTTFSYAFGVPNIDGKIDTKIA